MGTSTQAQALPAATDTLGRKISRRRFRSIEEKVRIVEEAERPGISVAEVARRHGLNANLLFSWRRLHREGLLTRHTRKRTALLAVQVNTASQTPISVPSSTGVIEIELPNGVRLRVKGEVDQGQLSAVLAAVAAYG